MVVRFTARSAGYAEDASDEVLEVGFSENEDGSGKSILINRSTADGAAEAPFGMDTYCVSNELGNSDYGGLAQVCFAGNEVQLAFSEESAAILGTDAVINITLDVPVEAKEQVKNGLAQILTWGRPDAMPELIGL
jgi:hypothetical protein